MKVVINTANRLEVARRSAEAVNQLLNELRQTADENARGAMIVQSVARWQGLFSNDAGLTALAAFNTSLKQQTANGSAGIEVLQCARILGHLESTAQAEAKRKRMEAGRARMAAFAQKSGAAQWVTLQVRSLQREVM